MQYYSKSLIKYKAFFSFEILKNAFKKYGIGDYISVRLLSSYTVLSGGLFASSFYLNNASFGILTIIVTIMTKLNFILGELWGHLTPIYFDKILKKNFKDIKNIIYNLTNFMFSIFVISIISLLTLGKFIYSLYFGETFIDTYFIFLIAITALFFYRIFSTVLNYLYVYNIKFCNKISFCLTVGFFAIFFPLIKIWDLNGVIVAYVISFLGAGIFLLIYLITKMEFLSQKDDLYIILISTISLIITLFVHYKNVYFSPKIAILGFIIFTTLFLLHFKQKIIQTSKYIIFEI